MTFLAKRALKIGSIFALAGGSIAGVTAGLVTGITSATDEYTFISAQARPATSLNYMRETLVTGQFTLGNAVEGLFSVYLPPDESSVHQLVGIAPITFSYHSKDGLNLSPMVGFPDDERTFATYLAPGMAIAGEIGSDGENRVVAKLTLRTDSYWSNGDQVTADDFVNTWKYAFLPSNPSVQVAALSRLAGGAELQELIALHPNLSLTDLDKDPAYNWLFLPPTTNARGEPHGGGVYATIVRDPTTGKITDQFVTFTLSAATEPAINDVSGLIGSMTDYSYFYPVNRKFIESVGGYNSFGRDAASFVSNGPFKIQRADLDLEILYKPNEGYWDRGRVLNKGFLIRIIPDTTTQQALFKTGKIGNVAIAPDQFRVFASDPYFRPFLKKSSGSTALDGWFFNLDSGANHLFTRNIHFRRALTYGINRRLLLAAQAFDGTPSSDIFTPEIEGGYKDENGTYFRNTFLGPTATNSSPDSVTFTVNGFKQKMIYYDRSAYHELVENATVGKINAAADPRFNPELARKEFALFEEDMRAQGISQNVYSINAMMRTNDNEQAVVMMDQSLREVLGGKLRVNGFFVAPNVFDGYLSNMDPTFDLWQVHWGQDTPDPFSFLRLWALLQDKKDDGSKYNVSFGSYLVYTSPKGLSDPEQFSMMDDMERTMGYPKDEQSFMEDMIREYGVDWISYDTWRETKQRLLDWQSSHIPGRLQARQKMIDAGQDVTNYDTSGVVNTETQISKPSSVNGSVFKGNDILFTMNQSFKAYRDGKEVVIPSVTIGKAYSYYGVMELVLRLYSGGINTFQAGLTFAANSLAGIGNKRPSGAFNQSNYSFKLAYPCADPPKLQWTLPGCEEITKTSLPIEGDSQ